MTDIVARIATRLARMPSRPLRVGLVGWGLAGRTLHAPLIEVLPELELVAVVTSRPLERELFPAARRVDTVAELLADPAIDLVVIASPNRFHVEQTRMALAAGKHVVCDKPLAQTSREVRSLMTASAAAQRLVVPFQNRRWDADFRTVQELVRSGRLGTLHYYESSWSKYQGRPRVRVAWKAEPDFNGPLYDLCPHLIDQAVVLFGRPSQVFARIERRRPGSPVHDQVRLTLLYEGGLEVLLEVDQLDAFGDRRWRVRGEHGSFDKSGFDPQEAQLATGAFPIGPEWGEEAPANWGRLRLLANDKLAEERVESLPGDHRLFYQGVAAAILEGKPSPVPLAEVLCQLEISEAALKSHASRQLISLDPTE